MATKRDKRWFLAEIESDPEVMALFHDLQYYLRELVEEASVSLKDRKELVRYSVKELFKKYW